MAGMTGLLNQRIKIVLRRFHPETPREVVRGIITEVDELGIRVSGRRFQDVPDFESSLPEERPVEPESKVYWIPFNSIRYSEIVTPGSSSEREDNDVQRRKVVQARDNARRPSSD